MIKALISISIIALTSFTTSNFSQPALFLFLLLLSSFDRGLSFKVRFLLFTHLLLLLFNEQGWNFKR